mgnify:CR=1 FL=1
MMTNFIAGALGIRSYVFIAVIAAIVIVVGFLNLAVPETSSFYMSSYVVSLFGKYLCYAMLALAIDLVWGFCGVLSLGHGAFFALGGYAMGMYLMRQIGTRGVYGHPELPDFMVFLNWKELPWYWYGFDMFWFAALMAVVVPGLLAFAFGWFAFRSRVTGVYLSIITQAMTFALLLAFFRNDMGFGGNNGLTDFKEDLRAIYLKTGVKNIGTAFLFTDQQIFKESALIFLNDILSLGYPPGLFAEEDKDTIVNGVRNDAKQAGVMDSRDARTRATASGSRLYPKVSGRVNGVDWPRLVNGNVQAKSRTSRLTSAFTSLIGSLATYESPSTWTVKSTPLEPSRARERIIQW